MSRSSQHKIESRFFVAGVNYRTAPVEIRERMSVAHPDRLEVSRLLQLKAGLSEVVVLWTCNRVEIYGTTLRDAEVDVASMFECLARETPNLASHTYCHCGNDAVKHLFKVASGIDSMVMGETQITGQVRDAYEAAQEAKLVGKVLNSVFQKALRTAKRIRTQTSMGCGARSVGGVAVAHARNALGEKGLRQHSVLMIGAGEMAACCLRHLQKKGACSVVVANRSLERARKLAAEFNGKAIPLDELYTAMAEVDIVISSTGSPAIIVDRQRLEPVMQTRKTRPLVMIDIAVPRDIDPGVAEIKGVHLHDIDRLESTVRQTLGQWEQDLETCEQIMEQEIEALARQFKNRHAAHNRSHHAANVAQAV